MDQVSIGGVAAGVFVGGVSAILLLYRLFIPRSEFNPQDCAMKATCDLRHKAVDDELDRRSRTHHDLAGEMQKLRFDFAKVDKKLAVVGVLLGAIAKAQNVDIPAADED